MKKKLPLLRNYEVQTTNRPTDRGVTGDDLCTKEPRLEREEVGKGFTRKELVGFAQCNVFDRMSEEVALKNLGIF